MRKTTPDGKDFLPDRQAVRSKAREPAQTKTGAHRPDPIKMAKARQTPDKMLLFTMGKHKQHLLVPGGVFADGVSST